MITIGNRVPRDYFVTKGSGESDITQHAGSFHLALRQAGIESQNVMTYSSILPAIAHEVPCPPRAGGGLVHGAVMESIMSVSSCEYGETCTAGLIYGWLTDHDSGQRYGGLVAEYNGSLSELAARVHLIAMINELHRNGYANLKLDVQPLITQSITPGKRYGTALVAMCFTSYDVPVIELTT